MSVSTSLPHRLAQRVWARRWSRLKTVSVLLVVVLVAGAAGWVIAFSSVFGVRSVEVTGTGRLTSDEVAAAAAVERGTPLARLDADAVAARVRELAPVRTATVRRQWPGTVQIVVQERVPAAVQQVGRRWALVDDAGVAFAEVRRRPRGLPEVSAPVGGGAAELEAAVTVLGSVPLAVRRQVREVRAASPDHVILRLSRDRTVVWGDLDRDERKGAVLAALISRKASVYDVSAPDAPTTRN